MHIRKDDTVQVLTGDQRGQRGRVLAVDHSARKLIVEGVNLVYKHVRRTNRNPQGGRLSKEMPIPMSNAILVCERCGQATRTGARFNKEGAKLRYCKKCGAELGMIAPPHRSHSR